MVNVPAMRAASMALLALLAGCDGCSKNPPPAESRADVTVKEAVGSASKDAGAEASKDAGSLATGPWNVLLVTVDSLRADMPWAGYDRPIAPRLAALHARSISYSHAYSTSSLTSKSVPGMLTGRYPSELVRTGSFFTKYVNADQFVCKHLGAEDIPCVGAHAHMYFGPGQSGFETGFQSWKIVP
jgi:choline-sulfatase